jgi:hypothetical protein
MQITKESLRKPSVSKSHKRFELLGCYCLNLNVATDGAWEVAQQRGHYHLS